MKKKLLLGIGVLAVAMGLSSCSNDSDNSQTSYLTIPVYNLYTNPDADANSVGTALVGYRLTTTFPDNTISISSNGMPMPGGGRSDILTSPIPFNIKYMQVDGAARQIFSFANVAPGGSNPQITNLNGTVTQAVFAPPTGIGLPASYDRLVPTQLYYIVMQYNLSGYTVRTFWPDMTFSGSTATEYPGMEEAFSTDGMLYRVIMHRGEDNSIQNKADVVFYNAKFAPKAPELAAIVLKDLDLTFDLSGYKIQGSAIVPQILMDGGNLIDNSKFTFNNFNIVCGGDMTGATIYYEVAGMYKGRFSGKCVIQ